MFVVLLNRHITYRFQDTSTTVLKVYAADAKEKADARCEQLNSQVDESDEVLICFEVSQPFDVIEC